MQYACPEGAIIYEVDPRNGCPIGYPYGCPAGVPIEAHEVWPIIWAKKSVPREVEKTLPLILA